MFWEMLNVDDFAASLEKTKGVCLFPLGCLEKHGNHLPLGTDVYTAREISARAAAIEEAMIFPYYPLGIVAEVRPKAGTVAVSSQLQFQMLEAIFGEISRNGYKKIILCNGHGGSSTFLQYLARATLETKRDYTLYVYDTFCLRSEQHEAIAKKYGPPIPGGHADIDETSQMLAAYPELVHMDLIRAEQGASWGRSDWYRERGVFTGINWYANYPYQLAGDPTDASAERGEDLLNFCARNLAEIIRKLKEDDTLADLFAEYYEKCEHPSVT